MIKTFFVLIVYSGKKPPN